MRDAHLVNAWLLIGFNAVAGAWCLAAYRWPTVAGRTMWLIVAVAQITTFTQAIFGAVCGIQ